MSSKEEIISKIKASKPQFLKLGIQNIGLFGSYLRNEQKKGSDIDLLVEFAPDQENFDNFMAAYDLQKTDSAPISVHLF